MEEYYIFFANKDVIITLDQCLRHKKVSRWASETVQLLKQMTPDFIPPTNSPDLNSVDYAVCMGLRRSEFTRRSRMLMNCVNRLWGNGMGTTRPACDWQCDQTVAQ